MTHAPIVALSPDCMFDPLVPVWLYGDGSGGGWSVVQHYRRIGNVPRAVLRDARFVVQREVLAGMTRGFRNIHAFAEGWLDSWPADNSIPAGAQRVRYRPDLGFYASAGVECSEHSICAAEAIYFDTTHPLGVGLSFGPAADPGGAHIVL